MSEVKKMGWVFGLPNISPDESSFLFTLMHWANQSGADGKIFGNISLKIDEDSKPIMIIEPKETDEQVLKRVAAEIKAELALNDL